ncbi:MAG: hypothetical protein SH818_04445 [Saprospiraceae bacterium]|nr:hypothetical protein [Saprospiraceae bacterium]
MKNPLLLILCLFTLSIACNKSELLEEKTGTNSLNCKTSAKAVVKKQNLNELGTDYFFYLAIENAVDGSAVVYPSQLASFLQEEGKRVEIKYNKTQLKHNYVLCLPGHIYDPANADEKTMPVIEVCQAAATL